MEQMSFNEFYSVMDISGIIIVEDNVEFDLSRNAVMYDLLMMKNTHIQNLIEGIDDIIFKAKLESIYQEYSNCMDSFEWQQVPKRDIEYYIEKQGLEDLNKAIKSVDEEEIRKNSLVFQRYGVGIKAEKALGYQGILENSKVGEGNLTLRVYTDFAAPDMNDIFRDVQMFAEKEQFFLCIIDNFMHGEARGREIIDELSKNKHAKEYGICIVLSSQEEDIARETDEMYVGFVKKKAKDIDNQIKRHLIMSQYKIMLNMLINKKQRAIKKAFEYATNNMKVAIILASMAKEEGITNHEILNEWIELRERYYSTQESKEELKRAILLSSLFERITSSENEKELEPSDVEEFQRFEQYDYNVNEFLLPPMTGDIFYIKGKYYLLVGQECDLSIRDGQRNNSIAEMIPITLVKDKDMGKNKEEYNFEKLLLGKFKDIDGQVCNISINCTQREIIDNEILDLCTFNTEGNSQLCITQELDVKMKYMLPTQWHHYYVWLKTRLQNLKDKYDTIEKNEKTLGFNVAQLVSDMGASHNNRLISIIDFIEKDNLIKYDVRRICRIRNHVLLINKLYLEYRGRQAFNTINMDAGRTNIFTFELENDGRKVQGKRATVIMTTSRKENDNTKSRDWLIQKDDLLQFIEAVKPEKKEKYITLLNNVDAQVLLEGRTGIINKNVLKYTKKVKDRELILEIKLLR